MGKHVIGLKTGEKTNQFFSFITFEATAYNSVSSAWNDSTQSRKEVVNNVRPYPLK
jgi:hypothetical protein